MLGVVKKVLQDTQKNGLKADHHFFLTYSTSAEGVEIPSTLLEKYPDEITIVLQHEFEDLVVKEDHFVVTLWFNNVPAHLRVPFKAIKAFFDPSVKFGLQFNLINEIDEELADNSEKIADITQSQKVQKDKKSSSKETNEEQSENKDDAKSNIISLDSFRKK
jgi:hypothetical protein